MNGFKIESEPGLPSLHQRQALREAAGLSMTQLGVITGVSSQSIRYWETGQREPRGLQRIAYAKALATLASESSEGAK
jgi:DNA-binding transcriptional regulator YiaG